MLALGLGVGTIPWLLLGELCPAQVLLLVFLSVKEVIVSFFSVEIKSNFQRITVLQSTSIK
jgi:hypothetical protein